MLANQAEREAGLRRQVLVGRPRKLSSGYDPPIMRPESDGPDTMQPADEECLDV